MDHRKMFYKNPSFTNVYNEDLNRAYEFAGNYQI